MTVTKKIHEHRAGLHLSEFVVTRTRLLGVKGRALHYDEYQCVVKKVPHPTLQYQYKRECRVVLKIPASAFVVRAPE